MWVRSPLILMKGQTLNLFFSNIKFKTIETATGRMLVPTKNDKLNYYYGFKTQPHGVAGFQLGNKVGISTFTSKSQSTLIAIKTTNLSIDEIKKILLNL